MTIELEKLIELRESVARFGATITAFIEREFPAFVKESRDWRAAQERWQQDHNDADAARFDDVFGRLRPLEDVKAITLHVDDRSREEREADRDAERAERANLTARETAKLVAFATVGAGSLSALIDLAIRFLGH